MKKTLGLSILALLALVLAAPPAAADGFGMDLGLHGGVVGVDGGDGNTFIGGAQARFHIFWIIGAEARASFYSDTLRPRGHRRGRHRQHSRSRSPGCSTSSSSPRSGSTSSAGAPTAA